jgi:hypothetical protein
MEELQKELGKRTEGGEAALFWRLYSAGAGIRDRIETVKRGGGTEFSRDSQTG